MAIFEPGPSAGHWKPSPLAAGPFSGLQGGAIASLLTAEVEALAGACNWGAAVSVTVSFLKPTPMTELRTQITPLREGGRVNVIDNTMFAAGDTEPCATARVTLSRERRVEAPDIPTARSALVDPLRYPIRSIASFHRRPWMMDAMDSRMADGVAWFHQNEPIIEGIAPGGLSSVLGPADWAHGIARPLHNVVADPNPNLTVQLLKAPANGWIGIRANAQWDTQRGLGIGGGAILDVQGEIGSVSMAVVLTPFPKQAAAAGA
ncbi:MAG: thioesterase family protein [Afipia sp.]|nr:thioesterase family protein [Afipia sp.]